MEVDVKAIVEEIKKEIKEQGLVCDILSFEDVYPAAGIITNKSSNFNKSVLVNEVKKMNKTYEVEANKALTSHIKIFGKIVIFVKRAIRKLSRFYIAPIVEEQNNFNSLNVRALNQLVRFVEATEDKERNINELQIWYERKLHPACEKMLEINYGYEKREKEIVQKIDALQAENELLRKHLEKVELELSILKMKNN